MTIKPAADTKCPMLEITADVLSSAEALNKNMKNLRRQIRKCLRCQGMDCPILVDFYRKIEEALTDVNREYQIINPSAWSL